MAGIERRDNTVARLSGRRAQLLLAGAFVLAVALVGLTIVFSANSYTETLSEQDNSVQRGGNALAVRESVTVNLGDILARVNRGDVPSSTRSDQFQDNVTVYANATNDYHARNGRLVNVSADSITLDSGARIEQDSVRNFRDPSMTNSDWYPVPTDSRVRNMRFNFTNLPSSTGSPPFVVQFNVSGNNDWKLLFSEASGNAELTVDEVGGSFEATCRRPFDPTTSTWAKVNVSEATFNGEFCPALAGLDPAGDYRVRFENGTIPNGRYSMLTSLGTGTVPSSVEVIYSAEVPFRYYSSTIAYERELRIAPGEI